MGLFNVFKKKDIDYKDIKIKLKRLFNIEPKFTNFGNESGEVIGLYLENVFDKVQVGYRVDFNGYKNKKWIGDKYFIIGDYNGLGDPLIVDVSDEKLPIFAIMHDDWKNIEKIADSVEDFSKIMKLINDTDINNENMCLKLKEDISKITKCEFWNNQIDLRR